jgi:hypothetical protein
MAAAMSATTLRLEYDGERLDKELQPYRNLWAEVLRIAVEDATGNVAALQGGDAYHDRDQVRALITDRARAWLSSDDRLVGSFLWICGLLELNAEAVREAIEAKTITRGKQCQGRSARPPTSS